MAELDEETLALQYLLQDRSLTLSVNSRETFGPLNQTIFSILQSYYTEFKEPPTETTIVSETKKLVKKKKVSQSQIPYLSRVIAQLYSNIENAAYKRNEAVKFLKKAAHKAALKKSIQLYDEGNYDAIYEEIVAARYFGEPSDDEYFYSKAERDFRTEERIPTGIERLDLYTGGIGKKEEFVVLGLPKSGKCEKRDSLVYTRDGLVPIGSLEPAGQRIGQFCNLKTDILTKNGFKSTSSFYHNGFGETFRITTNEGFEIEGTSEHPVLAMAENGNVRFRELGLLKVGDYICIDRRPKQFGKELFFNYVKKSTSGIEVILPRKMSNELARFLGYLVGEGTTTHQRALHFTNSNGQIVQDMQKISKQLFDFTWQKVKNRVDFQISRVQVRKFLEYLGIAHTRSNGKTVPWVVLQSSREHVRNFLRALFDGEGHVRCQKNGQQWVELSTASEVMSRQLQIVLLGFGIVSSRMRVFVKSPTSGIRRPYWRISIYRKAELERLEREIGFLVNEKRDALRKAIMVKKFEKPNLDKIPYQSKWIKALTSKIIEIEGSSRESGWHKRQGKGLRRVFGKQRASLITGKYTKTGMATPWLVDLLLEGSARCFGKKKFEEREHFVELKETNYYYSKISKISKSKAETVDLTIPGEHSFVSNGFISHNSISLLNFSASAVLSGFKVDFVTLELSAKKTLRRFDSRFSGIPYHDLPHSQELFGKWLGGGLREEYRNSLVIKEFPTGTMTASRLEAHLDKLDSKYNFIPDLIVVDYADIMRSEKRTPIKRFELADIYENLRRIAVERNCAVLTASQSNRTGLMKKVITIQELSEAFSKSFTADIIISICATPNEMAQNFMRYYIAATRETGSGREVLVKTDFPRILITGT